MAVQQYDPKNISVIVDGKIISGFGDGTFVLVERNNQAWNLKVGVDGEGTRAKSNDLSGKFTFTLMQSSASNDVLSALAVADEQSSSGAVPVLIRDNLGTSLCTALTAWVQKIANLEDAKEVSPRTWVLETDQLNMFVGGNQTA